MVDNAGDRPITVSPEQQQFHRVGRLDDMDDTFRINTFVKFFLCNNNPAALIELISSIKYINYISVIIP